MGNVSLWLVHRPRKIQRIGNFGGLMNNSKPSLRLSLWQMVKIEWLYLSTTKLHQNLLLQENSTTLGFIEPNEKLLQWVMMPELTKKIIYT